MQHKETTQSLHRYWLIIIIIMGVLLTTSVTLVGCVTSQSDVQERESAIADTRSAPTAPFTAVPPSATPVASLTPIPTATTIPMPSATPSPTTTPISSPSATPTMSPTPAPTLTPLPTIEPQQRGQVYTDLMSSNGGCALPCWWGFELGKTPLEEVRQFYAAFDTFISEEVGPNDPSVLYVKFVDPQIEDGIQVRHTFLAQDGLVIEAEIEVVYDRNYQIEPLLQRLGQPSEVWMWTIPDTYEGVLPVSLLLFFPERGVLVSYAVFAERVDDMVQACFDDTGGTILLLWKPAIWNPDGDKGFVERANESSELTPEDHHPIDEVSNWDAEQFYTILSDPTHSACLETPSNLWPHP